jgi:hypothetical protein
MGVPEASTFRAERTPCKGRLLHDPVKISARFDDPNLVSLAGPVLVMSLAERAGLHALARRHVQITAKTRVCPDL